MIRIHGKIGSLLRLSLLGIVWLLCSASSCTTTLRNEQLESVAKDWALVIRASQVIPVYPLSEDLQPGDVLLVSTPIENQVALYKEKGFLPLDQHLVRLYSNEFKNFYNSRYGTANSVIPPAQWQTPTGTDSHNWKLAPRAAFPTYQFAVNTGSGLNLAIPIHGVPFALGIMNSGKASGTVTISDASTFGLDNVRLTNLVQTWALASENRSLLSRYAPSQKHSHFLRVISRVYVTGEVSVTVNNDEATSGQASGGADKPIEFLGLTKGANEKNYSDALEALNKFASEKLPGGKVKVATASSRSVTLSEKFERPLVIGYVGFDMPILNGGRLGPPISTLTQLNAGAVIPARDTGSVYRLAAISHIYNDLRKFTDPEAIRIRTQLDALAQQLPSKYSFSVYNDPGHDKPPTKDDTLVQGSPVAHTGFSDFHFYLSNARSTINTLDKYLARTPNETLEERAIADTLVRERQAAKADYDKFFNSLTKEPALMQAVDLVMFEQ